MTAKTLISKCLKGDRKAQQKLFDRYKGLVMGICLRYAGNSDLAQDMLQEAFLKVYTQLHQLENEKALPGWIRSLTIRVALNYYKQQMQKEHEPMEHVMVNAQNYEVDVTILSELEHERLLTLIQELKDSHRMVFNLFCIEGYTHKEISQKLGITEASSRVYLTKAKKVLQEKILFTGDQNRIAYG
ncbi:MAG: sigma-70 family RNA polymerase sigma factor [Bacteroidota bacterium]